MFSTCIFCHSSLGSNESIEYLPIGRRLAFDSANGRLWVVCQRCERWNLTPIEERWEALEECERQFLNTKRRYSTDQIGLARVGDGLDLIRIGAPLRPEFAAWRYGDQFGRRRRRKQIQTGVILGGIVLLAPVGPAVGLSIFGGGTQMYNISQFALNTYRRMRIVARAKSAIGTDILLRGSDVDSAEILPATATEPWGLRIRHHLSRDPNIPWWSYDRQTATSELRGDEALRIAGQLLPRLNHSGASASHVRTAVTLVERSANASSAFDFAARLSQKPSFTAFGDRGRLKLLPTDRRLALEMIAHEDAERRALEGDLYLLEEAWREAEEIAAISDRLLVAPEIESDLARMKGQIVPDQP